MVEIKLIAIAVVIFLTAAISVICQAAADRSDRQKYPPIGKLVDVGGYQLHIHSMGESTPTVVVDTGQGSTTLEWSIVQPEVAKFTRIVTYERAGYGWSELTSSPRTSQQSVEDLHQLLVNAGIAPPYILVGMSLGGLNVRLYAYQYPDEVAGMVLVDVTHEDFYQRYPRELVKIDSQIDRFSPLAATIARFGVMRLIVRADKLPFIQGMFQKLPADIQPMAKAVFSQTKSWKAFFQESLGLQESLKQVREARVAKAFPNIPLVVLTATNDPILKRANAIDVHKALHADLASLSPQGKHIISEKSGHVIQLDEPELVISAIYQVVEEVRRHQATVA